MITFLLICILLVLIIGFMPGLLGNIFDVFIGIACFFFLWWAFGPMFFVYILGSIFAMVLIAMMFTKPSGESAEDILKKIRERADGPEGNIEEF